MKYICDILRLSEAALPRQMQISGCSLKGAIMTEKYPVVFAGHGSPMNAVEPGRFRDGWKEMGQRLGKPRAILALSAHYYTNGQFVNDAAVNRQIFDMYGFPDELYQVRYAPQSDPETVCRVRELLGTDIRTDSSWGIDHGIWAVLCNMYPEADIPVVMISTDGTKTPGEQYAFGARLSPLREDGVMIFASGNVVHNLQLVDWNNKGGAPWAEAFHGYIKKGILEKRPKDAVHFNESGLDWQKAVPTPEHYYPLLAALGAAGKEYRAETWNEGCELGSMSMTSYLFNS